MTPAQIAGIGLLGLGAAGLAAFALTQQQQAPPPGPGCVPLQLIVDGPGSASGCGGSTRSVTQVCPQMGETCVFTAYPDGGAAFSQWVGPNGEVSTSNPISLAIWGSGFVRAVFTQLAPSPPQRTPCPTSLGAIVVSDAPGNDRQYVVDGCGRKHWIDSGAQFALCIYNPFGISTCNVDALPEGPSVGNLGCCPGSGDGQCRGC